MDAARPSVLVVGGGAIAVRHLRNLREVLPESRLAIVARSNHSGAEDAAAQLGADLLHDLDEAETWPAEAVVVATPTPDHVDHALRFARLGVHVLVEKPFSTSRADAERLLATCLDLDVVLQVAYNLRFHEPLRRFRAAVREGRVGTVQSARFEVGMHLADWRPLRPYRDTVSARRNRGGGVLLELSHEIDAVLWVLGPASLVAAHLGHVGDLDVDAEDVAELILATEGGAVVSVHLDMLQRPATRSWRVAGSEGVIEWDADTELVRWMPAEGTAITLFDDRVDWNDMYRGMILDFLRRVEAHTGDTDATKDAIMVLDIVAAARRRDQENRR